MLRDGHARARGTRHGDIPEGACALERRTGERVGRYCESHVCRRDAAAGFLHVWADCYIGTVPGVYSSFILGLEVDIDNATVDHIGVYLAVRHPWLACLRWRSNHDRLDTSQHLHRAILEEDAGEADEEQGSQDAAHERVACKYPQVS